MKKLLVLFLMTSPLFGAGPKNRFEDPRVNDEYQNVYKDIKNPIINYGQASSMTITNLTVTNCTGCGAGSSITVSTLTVTSSVTLKGSTSSAVTKAGDIGEIFSSTAASVNFPATTQFGDCTSIVLTAGYWMATTSVNAEVGSAVWSQIEVGISTSTGNNGNNLITGYNRLRGGWANASATPLVHSITVADIPFFLSSGGTLYSKFAATFSSGLPQAGGCSIHAIRYK